MSADGGSVTLTAIPGIPAIRPGDDIAAVLADAMLEAGLELRDGDVLVVTHKIISKAENRYRVVADVTPSPRARELARATGKDAALVEIILSESRDVVRFRPGLIICEHRSGVVMANAGVDFSNVPPDDDGRARVLLLPENAQASSVALRSALAARFGAQLAVIVSDSVGRAWRNGVIGLAIGVAGAPALQDLRGRIDREGRALEVTQVGVGDALASAAQLVMGEADEGQPAVLIRGLVWREAPSPAEALIRDRDQDLFR